MLHRCLIPIMLISLCGIALSDPYRPGDVLIASGGDEVSERDSENGSVHQTLTLSPSGFTTADTVSGGGYLALDEDGNLYVTVSDYEGTGHTGIIKFDSSGNRVTSFNGDSDSTVDYRGITVRDGIIYVARESGIRRFKADTGDPITGILGSGAFRDVTFDDAGNLYGLKESSVIRFSGPDFETETTVIEETSGDFRSLQFDNEGNLYITDGMAKVIYKYDSSFTSRTQISTGLTEGKLIGLAYDSPANTFYVSHTDTSRNQILSFTPSDSSTTDVPNTSGIAGARDVAVYPTPEPLTLLLFGAGGMFLYLMRRRRKRKTDA